MAERKQVARDPVCGIAVNRENAETSGLRSRYGEQDELFCGRGCKLGFDADPARFLDHNYIPTR